MEKSFDAQTARRQHRRGTGEPTHRQHGIRPAGFEMFARRAPRLAEAAQESEPAAPLQRDGRKGDNFKSARGFHGLLIHIFWRNQNRDRTPAHKNLPGYGQTWKEMTTGPAASDGDVRRVGTRGVHVDWAAGNSSAANGFTGLNSGIRPCRATLNNKPTQPSMASRLDPP